MFLAFANNTFGGAGSYFIQHVLETLLEHPLVSKKPFAMKVSQKIFGLLLDNAKRAILPDTRFVCMDHST
jgi:hypothetical protein